ncbi:hypothetical protein KFE25_001157 [Diacronema lutheri]|uniref:Uncharacterized protein n=1 Tax=Diacronema lutheri TaxID=2081491 RepID=A0A8J5X858_DIALT|nr:hypothetical protein KFE25_001157 [Diacronema lutheri]
MFVHLLALTVATATRSNVGHAGVDVLSDANPAPSVSTHAANAATTPAAAPGSDAAVALASARAPAASAGTCSRTLAVNKELSLLDVSGELNGHSLSINRRSAAEGVGPTGNLAVTLSTPCPASIDDLLDDFSFTFESAPTLLIHPQDSLVLDAPPVRIKVYFLQVKVRTTAPIRVSETSFEQPDGLYMEIVAGTAKAGGKSMDLTGLTATFSLSGYFDVVDGALELHVEPSPAEFEVDLDNPQVQGSVVLTPSIIAMASHRARRLIGEHVERRLLEEGAAGAADAAPGAAGARSSAAGAVLLVGLVASVAVAAAWRRAAHASPAAAIEDASFCALSAAEEAVVGVVSVDLRPIAH